MRKYFVFFILLYLISFSSVQAESLTTTGFIPGQIWYSKDVIVEGDTVKIYTAIWNNSTSSLSAKVEFYDKNIILGTRDVVVPSLGLKEASISWKVTAGDHLISAKIISPSIMTGGKKQVVILDNNTTEESRKFVPIVIKTIEGNPATSGDIFKSQIDKATSSLDNILPTSISTPISKNLGLIDTFRDDTNKKISLSKDLTKEKIDALSKSDDTSDGATSKTDEKVSTDSKTGIEDATSKPIAYIKLFFLSVLSFIFSSKLVFYAVLVFLIFLIIRSIYRKIRNRY